MPVLHYVPLFYSLHNHMVKSPRTIQSLPAWAFLFITSTDFKLAVQVYFVTIVNNVPQTLDAFCPNMSMEKVMRPYLEATL